MTLPSPFLRPFLSDPSSPSPPLRAFPAGGPLGFITHEPLPLNLPGLTEHDRAALAAHTTWLADGASAATPAPHVPLPPPFDRVLSPAPAQEHCLPRGETRSVRAFAGRPSRSPACNLASKLLLQRTAVSGALSIARTGVAPHARAWSGWGVSGLTRPRRACGLVLRLCVVLVLPFAAPPVTDTVRVSESVTTGDPDLGELGWPVFGSPTFQTRAPAAWARSLECRDREPRRGAPASDGAQDARRLL